MYYIMSTPNFAIFYKMSAFTIMITCYVNNTLMAIEKFLFYITFIQLS